MKIKVILSWVKKIIGRENKIKKTEIEKAFFFSNIAESPINTGIILDKKLPSFFSSPNIPVIICSLMGDIKNISLPKKN